MKFTSIIIALFREIFSKKQIPREPEPMVMDRPESVAAFKQAGDDDGLMAGVYFFNAAHATQTLQGCKRVLDLGCGSASLLTRLAIINPEIHFTGLDFSEEMLNAAQKTIDENKLTNIELKKADFTDLRFISDHSYDGVMSSLALHHLPSHEMLQKCFQEAHRVLKPGGALFFSDLGRLKSLQSIITFAYEDRDDMPYAFNLDSERSYRAAFLPEDFKRISEKKMPNRALSFSQTWGAPLMMMMKTPKKVLPIEKITKLKSMKDKVHKCQQRDIRQLQTFFRFGGLSEKLLGDET